MASLPPVASTLELWDSLLFGLSLGLLIRELMYASAVFFFFKLPNSNYPVAQPFALHPLLPRVLPYCKFSIRRGAGKLSFPTLLTIPQPSPLSTHAVLTPAIYEPFNRHIENHAGTPSCNKRLRTYIGCLHEYCQADHR